MTYNDFKNYINKQSNIHKFIENKTLHMDFTNPEHIEKYLIDDLSNPWFWGVVCEDVRDFDFSYLSADELSRLPFSTKTKWPTKDRLPVGFDYEKLIKRGLNSKGCGIEECHKAGLDGDGVCVAIIDRAFDVKIHNEFLGQFSEVNLPQKFDKMSQFHGSCVAARLCGKNLGVAPRAKFIYYGYNQEKDILIGEKTKIDILIEILNRVKNGEKIDIISMSSGFRDKHCLKQYCDIKEQLNELSCELITAREMRENLIFYSYCRDNFSDTNIENQYDFQPGKNCLYVQDGGKCSPLPFTKNDYFFEGGTGCMSYTIPQVAGMYAIARQLKDDLSFVDFIKIARKTADENSANMHFINLVKICKFLKYKENKNITEK